MTEVPCIGIVSVRNDLHALAVAHELRKHMRADCRVIEADCISDGGPLIWSPQGRVPLPPLITGRDGLGVDVSSLWVLWWRRFRHTQTSCMRFPDEATREVINNDCRAALVGMLRSEFLGTWVSDPDATTVAENKIVQLKAAASSGFRIPRTLVSQDPISIRQFCEALDYRVVVKALRGTNRQHLFTLPLRPEYLENDRSIRLAPAIYQEAIPGTKHLRVNVFGGNIYSALIVSDELDWRANLNVPVEKVELDDVTKANARAVLGRLNLKMGIIDLKIAPTDEVVWLEVNPQGQFLFLEPLTNLPLTSLFAAFLLEEALSERDSPVLARDIQIGGQPPSTSARIGHLLPTMQPEECPYEGQSPTRQ